MTGERPASSRSRLKARLVALGSLLLVVGGAAAQAGNTVLVADMGTALGEVNALQGLVLRLNFVFWPLAIVGSTILGVAGATGRHHGIRLRPEPGAGLWHGLRFAIGYAATGLVFAGTTLLKEGGKALGTATLFSNGGGFVTTLLSLFVGQGTRRQRLQDLVPAVIGITGMYVAVAAGVPFGEFMNLPVGLLVGGCVLLGVLVLVQRTTSDREGAAKGTLSPPAKVLLSLKISTVFALAGGVVSAVVYLAMVPSHGWITPDAGAWRVGVLLAVCYAASQLLLQAGHGFGNPGITGPMMFWAVPIGYLLDELRGVDGFTPEHLTGTALIGVAAVVSVVLTIRRNKATEMAVTGR
ncbi:MAG: hypothetical protein ACM32J_02800 [Rhizobacter sp.]